MNQLPLGPGLGKGRNATEGGRLSTELPAARFSWPVLGPTRPPSSSKHLPEQRSSRRLRLGPFPVMMSTMDDTASAGSAGFLLLGLLLPRFLRMHLHYSR